MEGAFELNEEEVSSVVGNWSSSSYQCTLRDDLQMIEVDSSRTQNVVEIIAGHIHQDLSIDTDHLVVQAVITETRNSVVFAGLYKGSPVAIKAIIPFGELPVNPDKGDMFEREVSMLSRADHENIVKFVGAAVSPSLMIVTELMEGGSLQKHLMSLRPNRLDLELAVKFALDISRAMEYLHLNGIIHRDLKPSNLLLTEDKKKIKIADFGLARELSDGDKTTEAGTYRWMAPELFSMEVALKKGMGKYYDHKVDVYSFSIILWELLTNETPFRGKSMILVAYGVAHKLRPSLEQIPPELAPLLELCWSHDPNSRPEFSEITSFLEKFYQNLCHKENKLDDTFQVDKEENQVGENTQLLPINKEKGKKGKRGNKFFRGLTKLFTWCSHI